MNVGFFTGMTYYTVATMSDFKLFFDAIDYMAIWRQKECPTDAWDLIRKSLFRHYLKPEQYDDALLQMQDIEDYFKTRDRNFVGWEDMGEGSNTMLNPDQPNMADIFSNFFRYFKEAIEEAKYLKEHEIDHGHVRMSVTSPLMQEEMNRRLEEYDQLTDQDTPLWLRHFKPVITERKILPPF